MFAKEEPGRRSRPERRVETPRDALRFGGELVLDQLRGEKLVNGGAVGGDGCSDADGHARRVSDDFPEKKTPCPAVEAETGRVRFDQLGYGVVTRTMVGLGSPAVPE